jgi:hypothetical protein
LQINLTFRLAGRVSKEGTEGNGRVAWADKIGQRYAFDNLNNEQTWNIIDTVKKIAGQTYTTSAQGMYLEKFLLILN